MKQLALLLSLLLVSCAEGSSSTLPRAPSPSQRCVASTVLQAHQMADTLCGKSWGGCASREQVLDALKVNSALCQGSKPDAVAQGFNLSRRLQELAKK